MERIKYAIYDRNYESRNGDCLTCEEKVKAIQGNGNTLESSVLFVSHTGVMKIVEPNEYGTIYNTVKPLGARIIENTEDKVEGAFLEYLRNTEKYSGRKIAVVHTTHEQRFLEAAQRAGIETEKFQD